MDAAADASSGQVRARGEDDDQPQPSKESAALSQAFAQAAECGIPWRTGHIQYRIKMLRWSLCESAVSVRVRQDSTLSSVALETAVKGACQLSGTPVLVCTFVGAHSMPHGRFHECVAERPPAGEGDGLIKIYTIPPDGHFELVHYTTAARDRPAGALEEPSALSRTLLPVEVCTFPSEKDGGRLFCLHARLRIRPEFQQLRGVRCIFPLHPHCRPGSVHVQASIGRAQVLDGDALGGRLCLVSWELASVGGQTGNTQEHERIECSYEAFLDVQCAIAGSFISFPYETIAEQSRPDCVPAESLAVDQGLWRIWNSIVDNLHNLDEMKKPFPRDRTSSKLQLRTELEQLKQIAESRLVSSCLSRALPPVDVKIERVFGPCFSGLDVQDCTAVAAQYPGVPSDKSSPPLFELMPCALGTSRHLSCTQLLFEWHAADFRHEVAPICVPVVVLESRPEIADDDVLVRRASSAAQQDELIAPGEDDKKGKPKKKRDAKTDTNKGPAKGGAAKGTAGKKK